MRATGYSALVCLRLAGLVLGTDPIDFDDLFDLSFLTKGAAIGDSYAAGIGAGNEVDYSCSRYDGSYASLVALQLGVDPSVQDFTYTACSGAVISGINDQASALSSGQQYVIVSAGGNDADLVGILNSCVYSFWGGLSHPDCDKKLGESQGIIQGSDFASKVDVLINSIKSKLAPGGNIYYVGYAKFWDTSDNTCDNVSWRIWLNLFTREYLTQARRQSMNDLVDLMNGALRDAVTRAGSQVHFIDYDNYVEITGGRYCQPGNDESRGRSANLPNLFFYEMKTVDSPWILAGQQWHQDLKRRQNSYNDDGDIQPDNNTLNALYGALIQEAIQNAGTIAVLEDDNTDNDLEAEVHDEEGIPVRRRAQRLSNLRPGMPPTYNRRSIPSAEVSSNVSVQHVIASSRSMSSRSLGYSSVPGNALASTWTLPSVRPVSEILSIESRNSRTLPSTRATRSAVSVLILPSENYPASHTLLPSELASNTLRSSRSLLPTQVPDSTSLPFGSGFRNSSISRTQRHQSSTRIKPSASTASGSIAISNLSLGSRISAAGLFSNQSTNSTASRNNTSMGIVVANQTHVLLANGKVVEKFNLKKLFVSDETSRVFHPTQAGHAMVANLILYQMAADNAASKGIADFPPPVVYGVGSPPPAIGGAACNTASSDTWANRDAMISSLDSFCADPHNLRGISGGMTSGVFNTNSFDYMNISISWEETQNIGEHSCSAWLDVVTDGCDASDNPDNWKHGGTIGYQSDVVNATLTIEPLVVRQIWDKGQAGGQQCNYVGSFNYLDQATLQSNINDYCGKSAAQSGGIANSGSTFTQTYNDGTPDRVILTTEWPPGPPNYQIFQDECQYYMSVINNGCNLPGADNPMNWKHGGSLTDNNGIKYTIQPTQSRPAAPSSPVGSCKTVWHVLYYSWTVSGGGFANSDWGGNLLNQIRGCGAVTAWTFDYLDPALSDGAEWTASGTLPIFISDHCLARAIQSAGGFPNNC